ncbi:hypothetical protein ACLB1Q_27595 [Escherichia coli]
MNGTFVTLCALPDAMLAHLIRPTVTSRIRRSRRVLTLTAFVTCAHRRMRCWRILSGLRVPNVGRIRRSRRIRH